MIEVFYVLVVLQILAAIYSLADGVKWLRLVRQSSGRDPGFYAPQVALICPVKGIEPNLEKHLVALLSFDYPNYEVFFTLASSQDPAYEVVRRVAGVGEQVLRPTPTTGMQKAHVVIAGAPEGCGEKVNNLRAAVEPLGGDFAVLVFADSDGQPPRHWLRRLVAPLADPELGAATTFRWVMPHRGGFWSALAAAWNAPIATFLRENGQHNFCWGGGTAIRRAVFEQVRALEFWRGSVSDDFSLTRALQAAGRRIQFVPECLVPSPHDTDFSGLFTFTNRQIIITRVYGPGLWLLALIGHGLYSVTFLLGLAVLLAAWASLGTWLPAFLLLVFLALLAATRGYLRLVAVSELLPDWNQKLLDYGWAWTLLAALVPFVYFWNALVAATTRRILWRGIRYELVSPSETRILV